jgi:predicted Fe-S protein YdhL (DUF1289 family)
MSNSEVPAGTARDDVASPCTKICRIGAHGHCVGCGRDLDEIMVWSRAAAPLKRLIRERAAARLHDHPDEENAA